MTIEVPIDTGLTSEEVAQRIRDGLANTLPPRSGRTTWDIVRANVFTRINAILLVLLGIVLSTGSWTNGAFGLLIIANSAIGIIQELRAKKTLDSLAVISEAHPRVRRNGTSVAVARDEIVLDDLIEIGPGDQIVVDGQVVASDYLEIDESLLTGEADPMPKKPDDPIMSGSFVVSGSGMYRATKVGASSYAAQLTEQASKFSLTHSELRSGIDSVLRLITWLLIPVGALTIIVQLNIPNTPWRSAVLGMAGALVPMVPEGLVLITSVAFALGVVRLGQRKCLVQEMAAIEGLARVDVVCADKTGTLTQNRMTLGTIIPVGHYDDTSVRDLLGQFISSDPRPNASVIALAESIPAPARPWTPSSRAPFTSAKKWSGATFAEHGSLILGAPDVLVTGELAARAEKIGSSGRRVLFFGESDHPVDSPLAPGEVSPIALIVLDQLIRPDAKDTLEYFADQDVTVKVISGDNAASVGAVTRSLGIGTGEPVDARQLPQDETEFAERIEHSTVFGRVTPEQKRQMVSALQSKGHTVAMTGDGVNDVLALKDADLGVAMGSGSPATRAVAQIVLLDDRFATLPHVVGEGRRVLGNIERVAKLFLTKTVYSVVLAALTAVFGLLFPFQPIHVTITGWFTIGIPAFLMSLAPNNDRARPGFVRRVIGLSLPAGLIIGVMTFVTYWLVKAPPGAAPEEITRASTATLATLILISTWVLAIVARPWAWWRLALVGASLLAYSVIFLTPWIQRIVALDPSDTSRMAYALVIGAIGICLIEALWWVGAAIRKETPQLWNSDDDPMAQSAVMAEQDDRTAVGSFN